MWCDLGFVPKSHGNKAAANLRLTSTSIPACIRVLNAAAQPAGAASGQGILTGKRKLLPHTANPRVETSHGRRRGP